MAGIINYDARDFRTLRDELLNYVRQNYPEAESAFSDSSVGLLLLELNAVAGDMLSFNTDRAFQETQLENAQARASVNAIARNFGLKLPGKRAAMTQAWITASLPVSADTYDSRYLPVIRQGGQVKGGGGKTFELREDVDFSSAFSASGVPNRLINPIRDANNTVLRYEITKKEIVFEGATRILSRVVRPEDVQPFFTVRLPEGNFQILSIESIITEDTVVSSTQPTLDDFSDPDKLWYEVPSLAEQRVFVEDPTVSAPDGVVGGRYMAVDRKFTTEFSDNGFLDIVFGSGTGGAQILGDASTALAGVLNNNALGTAPRANTTLWVRYRVGGGAGGNIGPNVLRTIGDMEVVVSGPDETVNQSVKSSIKVNNPIPAFGGANEFSVEEVRRLTAYNFATQNRAVTVRDYLTQAYKMPGAFGTPFRLQAMEEENKVKVYCLFLDGAGKLSNRGVDVNLQNVANWLAYDRMLNDYVTVDVGQIYNLGIDVYVMLDRSANRAEVGERLISEVASYMDINKRFMGENLYVGDLLAAMNCKIPGVRNVVEIKVRNIIGNGTDYSTNEVQQALVDETTREIQQVNGTIYGNVYGMFEVKYPQKDVRIFVMQ